MKIISSSTYDEMMHNHLELTEDLYFEIPSGEKLRKFCKKIRYGLHPEIFNYYREHDLDLFTVYKDYLVIHNDSLWKELKKKDEDSKMLRTNYDLNKENVTSGELNSSGPWNEPDKVKAIKETIEAVMKNHNTTDIREIDLDMLSSCINATINREKMYYEWLNEFTSDEVDADTIKFAFRFLDWVILNKIDEHSSLYFKK